MSKSPKDIEGVLSVLSTGSEDLWKEETPWKFGLKDEFGHTISAYTAEQKGTCDKERFEKHQNQLTPLCEVTMLRRTETSQFRGNPMLHLPPIDPRHVPIDFPSQYVDDLEKIEKGIAKWVKEATTEGHNVKKSDLWLNSTKARATGCYPALGPIALSGVAKLTWRDYI